MSFLLIFAPALVTLEGNEHMLLVDSPDAITAIVI